MRMGQGKECITIEAWNIITLNWKDNDLTHETETYKVPILSLPFNETKKPGRCRKWLTRKDLELGEDDLPISTAFLSLS